MAACRSCQRQIRWAIVKGSGKRIPLDIEPIHGANIEIVGERPTEFGPSPVVIVHGKDDLPLFGGTRYRSHFASCPHASSHRKCRTATR